MVNAQYTFECVYQESGVVILIQKIHAISPHALIKMDNYKGVISRHEVAQTYGDFTLNARNDTIEAKICKTQEMGKRLIFNRFEILSNLFVFLSKSALILVWVQHYKSK